MLYKMHRHGLEANVRVNPKVCFQHRRCGFFAVPRAFIHSLTLFSLSSPTLTIFF
jgi:hypothetical protein